MLDRDETPGWRDLVTALSAEQREWRQTDAVIGRPERLRTACRDGYHATLADDMHPAIGLLDRPAPAHESADFGRLRARVLDAHLHHRAVLVPHLIAHELDAWASSVIALGKGPTVGLAAATVPDLWYDLLAWSGVPLSVDGPLHWGVDINEEAVTMPEFHGDKLVLPPPPVLARLTSLALKPLRLLVARRLGCRLQAATGLHMFLWSNQAVLISHAEVPLGGFLHGPEPGTRHSVHVPVGGAQVLTW